MGKKGIQHKYQAMVAAFQKCGKKLLFAINHISAKKVAVCAAVLFLLSVIPLLLLGKYNVMCIDDYDYGRRVHDTWIATGSLWQSIRTAIEQTGGFFMDWQGTYLSCFLMAVCPMNFYYEIAFIVPVIMIGMFAISTFFFGRQVLVRWFGSDRTYASMLMFLLLFLFYQVMEAPFEGIYWYNGSTHYILMQSLLFILLTLVSGIIWTEKKKNAVLWCVLAAIDAAAVGGGNLVTGLQACILLTLLLIYTCVKQRKKIKYVAVPVVLFAAGFLCNILAPGNSMRASLDTDVGYSPVAAIILSLYYAAVFIVKWTNLLVVLVWLALLPVMWRIGKKSARHFSYPVWVTIGAFGVLAAMFTPTLYAVGMVGLSRVDNIIQMVYYLCLFLVTTYWFGWIAHHPAEENLGAFLESTGNVMTFSCILLMLLAWGLTPDKNTYTSISAMRSLFNGDAAVYYEEAMERHALYVDDTVENVVVEPYSAKPALFSFTDLSEDGDNWLNQAVANYYHKESVKIRKEND